MVQLRFATSFVSQLAWGSTGRKVGRLLLIGVLAASALGRPQTAPADGIDAAPSAAAASIIKDGLPPMIPPPVIEGFVASRDSGRVWTISGTVVCPNPGGLTVTIGDIVEATVTTADDGTFSYSVDLSLGQSGLVSAIATDEHGLESEMVEDFIFNDQPLLAIQ